MVDEAGARLKGAVQGNFPLRLTGVVGLGFFPYLVFLLPTAAPLVTPPGAKSTLPAHFESHRHGLLLWMPFLDQVSDLGGPPAADRLAVGSVASHDVTSC